MAHRNAASRRKMLDAYPELIKEALGEPLADARVIVDLAPQPTLGNLRFARDAERRLKAGLDGLCGHKSGLEHEARGVLKALRSWINRPDALSQFPHLSVLPKSLAPPLHWKRTLAALIVQRPQWRKGLDEEWALRSRQEAFDEAEREAGSLMPVAMPRKLTDLLAEIAEAAPSLTLAQRAQLHRKVQGLIFAGGYGDYPPDHVSHRALDVLAPPDLLITPPMGHA